MKCVYTKFAVVVSALTVLVSPLAFREEASRGPASIQVPQALDSDLGPAYQSFYSHFLGASQQWLSGLQTARGGYGMRSPLFEDPLPIQIQPFQAADLAWFQTKMWSQLMGPPKKTAAPRPKITIPTLPVEVSAPSAAAAF